VVRRRGRRERQGGRTHIVVWSRAVFPLDVAEKVEHFVHRDVELVNKVMLLRCNGEG